MPRDYLLLGHELGGRAMRTHRPVHAQGGMLVAFVAAITFDAVPCRHNAEQYARMSIEAVAVKCAALNLNQSSADLDGLDHGLG